MSRCGGGSGHENVLQNLVTALYYGRSSASPGSDLSDQRGSVSEIFKIFPSQILVPALSGCNRIGVLEILERIESLNVKGLGPNARYFFVNIGVESLNQRINDYDRHDANDHAQQRKR